jgi:DNA-binding NarL/FixJ family response regulator
VQVSTRILIVDHHASFRRDLAQYLSLLDAGYEVVGEAATDEFAVEEVGRLRPDIVLLDIDLPDRSGLITTRRIRQRWPAIAVIAIAGHADTAYRQAAFEAGAADCVDKYSVVDQLPPALAALAPRAPRNDGALGPSLGTPPPPVLP